MPTDYANCIATGLNWMGSECDLMAVNTYSGCVAEFEIKVDSSDFLRECRIASQATRDEISGVPKQDRAKFSKHRQFQHGNLQHPPHYYSFLIPEALEELAVRERPPYAGVLIARKTKDFDSWLLEWRVKPQVLSREPLSLNFMRVLAPHLHESYRHLSYRAEAINRDWSEHHRQMLTRIAEAVKEAEIILKDTPHKDAAIREAIYERAVSGMPRRDKEHVMRIYEKLYIEGQLDLF